MYIHSVLARLTGIIVLFTGFARNAIIPSLTIQDPEPPPANQCPPNLVITPAVWKELQMDEYITTIPDIDKIGLIELARRLGATNFFCGIGLFCNAGQICNPLVGRDWVLLLAVQRWNSFLNNLYAAVESAVTLVRDASAEIVTDFIPDQIMDHSLFGWAVASIVVGVLAGAVGALGVIFAPVGVIKTIESYSAAINVAKNLVSLEGIQTARAAGELGRANKIKLAIDLQSITKGVSEIRTGTEPLKPLSAKPAAEVHFKELTSLPPHLKKRSPQAATPDHESVLPSAYETQTINRLEKRTLVKRGKPPPSVFAYQRWAELDTHLAGVQNTLQQMITMLSLSGINQPFYSEDGLAKVVLKGDMFQEFPREIENQEKYKAMATLSGVSQFFQSMNMFITMNCDACKDKGPGGAWPQDQFLSYCTKDGSMRNIIRAEGNHARNEIKNAPLLANKYHFTTEYLTNKAIACQEKYGFYTEFSKKNLPSPTSVDSDCVFSLPVCDCNIKEVHHIRKKKKGTVTACREGAKLPI